MKWAIGLVCRWVELIQLTSGFGFFSVSIANAADAPPPGQNFYVLSQEGPPLPFFPPLLQGLDLPVYQTVEGNVTNLWIDDRAVDAQALWQVHSTLLALEQEFEALSGENGPPEIPGSGGGSGGGGPSGAYGGLTLAGDCTGYLLTPAHQATTLTLTLTNASGEEYDLFTTPNLNTPWSYLGRWTNSAVPWVITNPPAFESYYTVGCTNDSDADWTPNLGEILLAHDSDYDGQSDAEETWVGFTNDCTGELGFTINLTAATNPAVFMPKRLAFFRFNRRTWVASADNSR